MVKLLLFGSDEPARFCVASALETHADIATRLLGNEVTGYRGFLAREYETLEKEATLHHNPLYSEVLMERASLLRDFRERIGSEFADVQNGLLSAAHFYEIADREGYTKDYLPRVANISKNLITPGNSVRLANKLHQAIKGLHEHTTSAIGQIALGFEDDAKNYSPFFYTRAGRYQQVADDFSERFKRFEGIVSAGRPIS